MAADPIRKTILKNGITVLTYEDPGSLTASISITAAVGSDDESAAENGISHFVEHMLKTGTGGRTQDDIVLAIAREGNSRNAYTSHDETCYYVEALPDTWQSGFEILSDMVRDPVFPEAKVEQERRIILQEIKQRKSDAGTVSWENLSLAAFGEDSPAGRPVIGPAANVSRFSRDDLVRHHRKYYTGANLTVTAAGNLSHDEVVRRVRAELGRVPRGRKTPRRQSPAWRGGAVHADFANHEHVRYLLAFPIPGRTDPDWPAYQVAAQALGGGNLSPLFKELRERLGISYSVFAHADSGIDRGRFILGGSAEAENIGPSVAAIGGIIARSVDELSDDDIGCAKKLCRAAFARGLEKSSEKRGSMTAGNRLYGNPRPLPVAQAAIDAVTPADVRRVLRQAVAGLPVFSTAGPAHPRPPVEDICKTLREKLGRPAPARRGRAPGKGRS
jgi:predicted Zn-dependent peptidase